MASRSFNLNCDLDSEGQDSGVTRPFKSRKSRSRVFIPFSSPHQWFLKLKHRGYSVWITCEGSSLEEFAITKEDETTASCYICSEAGKVSPRYSHSATITSYHHLRRVFRSSLMNNLWMEDNSWATRHLHMWMGNVHLPSTDNMEREVFSTDLGLTRTQSGVFTFKTSWQLACEFYILPHTNWYPT